MELRGKLMVSGLITGFAVWLQADVQPNPYQPIIERNVFGLRPVPPPAPPAPPPEPPAPPAATVRLTGITSILSSTKALLEITDPTPGKTPIKPVMAVGERVEGVEVLAIDVAKNEVRIRNGNTETNLTFAPLESVSSAPAAPPAGVPPNFGRPMPQPNFPPQLQTGATPAPQNSGGRGIVLSGGGQTMPPATPTSFGAPGASAAFSAGGGSGADRSFPIRQVRTPTTPNSRPMSREEAMIHLELQRQMNAGKGLPPLPPTPITPVEDGGPEQ